MSILFVSNSAADFGGLATDTTATTERDPAYSPTGIKAINNSPMVPDIWPAPTGDLWLHFRWRTPSSVSSSGSDGDLLSFYDSSGAEIAKIDFLNGGMAAVAIGDTTVTGTYVSMNDSTVYTVDVRVSLSGGNITLDVYLGGAGAPSTSATAANTGGKTAPTRVILTLNDISISQSDAMYFSEFIVTDGEDTRGWRLATLEPNLDGTYTQWVGGVSELGDSDLATSAATNASGNRESWVPTAYGGPASPSSVRAVLAKARAQRGIASALSQIGQFLRISSVDYDDTPVTFATGEQKNITSIWDNNPSTSAPWNTADLSSIEVGLLALT